MKALVCAFAFCGIANMAHAADVWTVTEGAQGGARGVWRVTISNGALTGEADMTRAGQKLRFGVSGTVQDAEYSLSRTSPSDGTVCLYRGSRRPDGSILGSQACGPKSGPWTATPKNQ